MAEVKLFEVNLGETINNIKRLENELKEVKKQYKEAAIGSQEYYKAQAAGKELTAEIKKQNEFYTFAHLKRRIILEKIKSKKVE